MEPKRNLENICGTVEQVIYHSAESGFAVVDLSVDGTLVSAVGVLGDVAQGENLSMMGYYTTHATHGYQFKAETCEHQMPQTAAAIEKYLGSGIVKGIGPAIAKRIVAQFGDDTLRMIEQTPDRLAEVKGITQKRVSQLVEEFRQIFGVRSLMLYLSGYGVAPSNAVQIWKMWGPLAQDMLKQNPYLLCMRPFTLSFDIAEKMAQDLALPTDSVARVLAGLSYTLAHNLQGGHTCLPADKLTQTIKQLLHIDVQTFDDCLTKILENRDLCLVQKNKDFLCFPDFYDAEQYIAARLSEMVRAPLRNTKKVAKQIVKIEQKNALTYDALQREAIEKAVAHQVLILTGGPGTGKTTTLNGLIQVLEQSGLDLCVAAPTGRAAKRLAEVTGREAKTIHRLLEVKFEQRELRFARNEDEPLPNDVIVIDEMSMVDTLLFEALLRATKPTAKLILVGDYHQRATRFHVKSMNTARFAFYQRGHGGGRTDQLSSRMTG